MTSTSRQPLLRFDGSYDALHAARVNFTCAVRPHSKNWHSSVTFAGTDAFARRAKWASLCPFFRNQMRGPEVHFCPSKEVPNRICRRPGLFSKF
jgi:hypothetical protein